MIVANNNKTGCGCLVAVFVFLAIFVPTTLGKNKKESENMTATVETKVNSSDSDSQAEPETTEEAKEALVLYDENGVKVTYKGLETSSFRVKLNILIENNTDKSYTVQTRDFSVNDYMIDAILSCNVAGGKKMNDEIDIYVSDLEKNEINPDEIETAEFQLHFFNWDDWNDSFDSEIIKLNFTSNTIDFEEPENNDAIAPESNAESLEELDSEMIQDNEEPPTEAVTELESEQVAEAPTEPKKEVGKSVDTLESFMYTGAVQNDVTGKWYCAVCADNVNFAEYAVSYYNRYMHSGEIHAICNPLYGTTTKIEDSSFDTDNIYLTVYSYIDGEEHDAKLMFGGNVIAYYNVNKETGEITEE